jgi:hypothetical protein
MPMLYAYGQIAIEKASISVTRYVRPRGKGTAHSISRGPDLVISRERESSYIELSILPLLIHPRHIINASKNLIALDIRQVNAVASRIELDLRIGYAFTRFLTTSLRSLGEPFPNLLLSYGMF